ncbi:MAG: hypothetical protein ACXW2E_00265 [Nitrososphaeraceae archaeon]
MIIFDERTQPVIINNIQEPNPVEYTWVLDLNILDYTLSPLTMLEEIVCPSLELQIKGFKFVVPAYWNILIYDNSTTSQLDVVELSHAAGREFTALIYGINKPYPTPSIITVTNYFVEYKNVSPFLHKHQMLCHPISKDEWCSIGPSDSFNKFLKDKTIGDLIN